MSDTTSTNTDDGLVQLIPATITAGESPAAAIEAADALLRAIAGEARTVADKQAGHASTALEELARAYALVVSGPLDAAGTPPSAVNVQSRRLVPLLDRVIVAKDEA